MSHPLALCTGFAERLGDKWVAPLRAATFVMLCVSFSITAATAPGGDTLRYDSMPGLTAQLAAAVLAFLYTGMILISKFVLQEVAKADHFAELPSLMRFAMDLIITLLVFIGAVAGATAINSDCILPYEICYKCPVADASSAGTPDDCKPSGAPDGPYWCMKSCPHAYPTTVATGGSKFKTQNENLRHSEETTTEPYAAYSSA